MDQPNIKLCYGLRSQVTLMLKADKGVKKVI